MAATRRANRWDVRKVGRLGLGRWQTRTAREDLDCQEEIKKKHIYILIRYARTKVETRGEIDRKWQVAS
jgi:hypothetical protein